LKASRAAADRERAALALPKLIQIGSIADGTLAAATDRIRRYER